MKTDIFEINELIDTLLVLGKINETNLPRGESDLNEIIKAVCNQQGQYYNDKKIQFTVSLHPFPLPLPTEYAKVLFNNLVSNAIKFSPHHTKITISCDPQNKTISVEDNGAGITDEEQKKIFDRFYRGNEMRSKVKGYGLGLSLVKEICNEYGIKIMITSSKGVGTTVQLSF